MGTFLFILDPRCGMSMSDVAITKCPEGREPLKDRVRPASPVAVPVHSPAMPFVPPTSSTSTVKPMDDTMKDAPFLNLVLSVILLIAVGWLLSIGQSILLPIFIAVIAVYVMVSASAALGQLPVLRRLPAVFLRILVLGAFTVALLFLVAIVASTLKEIATVAPTYEANLRTMIEGVAGRLGLEEKHLWAEIRSATLDRIDAQRVVLAALSGFTSAGTTIFLVVVYAGFLMAERGTFPLKVSAALIDEERSATAMRVVTDVNAQIGQYLLIKTLINLVLGAISFVILWMMDVDFALFWAIAIALLNYIPYVGSYIGVAFPVVLSIGQFASLQTTLILLILLVTAQVYVGNLLEPRWIGRQLNMSPFAVLVALSLWAALWGVPGAILAIPMTSILIIVTSSFPATRFIAVLLSERVTPVVIPDKDVASAKDGAL